MTFISNDLICFSHLRWGFVYQRPQHLMSRFARHCRVYFIEEPVFEGCHTRLNCVRCPESGVRIVTPFLAETIDRQIVPNVLRELLDQLIQEERIHDFIRWYYTPMALEFSAHLKPALTIYDCMDELAAFTNAPASMLRKERQLFRSSDLVFTGGSSLFQAKRSKHPHVHLFPSGVDLAHFSKAIIAHEEPEDQNTIPHPRLGYAGVIDERMDVELISYLADSRPDWQIILLGPTAKIDPQYLPRRHNIHYLGMKKYDDLPAYLSGWDVALLPFAQNEATRYISPTKTPEYLAAGLPVVSTPIHDVVQPYGELGFVRIGADHQSFAKCVEVTLQEKGSRHCRPEVAVFLNKQSWNNIWESMERRVTERMAEKKPVQHDRLPGPEAAIAASAAEFARA